MLTKGRKYAINQKGKHVNYTQNGLPLDKFKMLLLPPGEIKMNIKCISLSCVGYNVKC